VTLLNIRDRGPFVQASALLMRRPEGLIETGQIPASSPSRGIQEVVRQAVTSPIRLSRLEVTVPYRVLPSNGVAGVLGYLLPVWP
jgi:hypothetical protein